MRLVTQEQMNGIWTALNAPPVPARPHVASKIVRDSIAFGWFRSDLLEDLFYESDRRLDDVRYSVDAADLAEALGYRWENVVRRPRKRSICIIYTKAITLSGFASLLLDLEALGFNLNPQPILDHLKPIIEKKPVLTADELTVLWSERTRGKMEISLHVEDDDRSYGSYKQGKFPNGYRYAVMMRKNGNPLSLTVTGPRHRRTRDPVKTVCNDCGHTWYRGDPDSSAAHRAEHKKRMQILDPRPHDLMLVERQISNDPELVISDSPEWKHLEIYRRAYAFKREHRYDFVQWQSSTGDSDPHVHGFLFTDDDGVIKGAAAFRWREPEVPETPFWGLQWVWVCPRYRRQGVLERRWKMMRDRFGDFYVEGPVSDSMQAFLAKRGDDQLMEWPSRRGKAAGDALTSIV